MRKRLGANPLPVVIFTVFVDLIGIGILIPVIPLLLADPRSPYFLLNDPRKLTDGLVLLGYLTAIYPFMQFLAAPVLGQLSDKYGRKKILAVSLFGTSISYVLFAIGIMTRNIPLLFASRAFDGITGGNLSVAQAAIADVTPPARRVRNFGLIGAAFGLGFILGPYIGGKLSDPNVYAGFDATTPFWFAAALAFLNAVFVVTLFPETLANLSHKLQIDFRKSFKNIIHAWNFEKLRVLFIVNFLLQAGFSFFVTFFSVYLIRKFGFSQGNIGDFFAFIGIWIAITQAFAARIAAKKFTEAAILRVTLFATGVLVFMYFLPNAAWQLYFLVPFFALANGLAQANLTGLVSRSASDDIQGEVLGINISVSALAQSIPPVLSGYIAASITPETPIVIASIVIIASALVFIFMFKPSLPRA